MKQWLAYQDFTIAQEVPASAAELREFFGDLSNLRNIHPLIRFVNRTSPSAVDEDGRRDSYRIGDRVPVGPLAVRCSYRVQTRVTHDGGVESVARQFPWVRLYNETTFEQTAGGTRVTERLRIGAPPTLRRMVCRQAVLAHTEMLTSLARHFGTDARQRRTDKPAKTK